MPHWIDCSIASERRQNFIRSNKTRLCSSALCGWGVSVCLDKRHAFLFSQESRFGMTRMAIHAWEGFVSTFEGNQLRWILVFAETSRCLVVFRRSMNCAWMTNCRICACSLQVFSLVYTLSLRRLLGKISLLFAVYSLFSVFNQRFRRNNATDRAWKAHSMLIWWNFTPWALFVMSCLLS